VILAAAQDTRSIYDGLAEVYLWVAGVVFALIAIAVAWILIRYRAGRDPGRAPGRTADAQRTEAAYVVVLALVAAGLMYLTFHSQDRVDALTPKAAADPAAVHVDVIGAQWQWRFRYPGARGQPVVEQTAPEGTPPELIVPVGRRVLFTGRSQDVLHDFWIPDLKFQRQVWPDHTERWSLVFPHEGRFVGLCAWFCGLYHQNMHFIAYAMPPRTFDAWLARRRRAART
jgi:cytochrome c oxidase subunit 2